VGGYCCDHRRCAGDDDTEEGLLKSERRSGVRRAGGLRRRRVGEPVPRHAQHARHDEQGHHQRERRIDRDGNDRGAESES
jgi:hypothetical protein